MLSQVKQLYKKCHRYQLIINSYNRKFASGLDRLKESWIGGWLESQMDLVGGYETEHFSHCVTPINEVLLSKQASNAYSGH